MNKWKIFAIVLTVIFAIGFLTYRFGGRARTAVDQTATVSLSDATTTDTYPVSRVVDGDTIDVVINGKQESVRLIGVNTPETVDPRKPVQCFGKEASNFLKNMLSGKSVRLESDPTQDNRDKYGRLLRYVYLDEVLVNEEIIQSGYGFEYTYDIPYEYQKEFKASEMYAKSGGLGLWATSTCNGALKPA